MDPVAGQDRRPVDSLVERGGRTWQFVDTAGLRRRATNASGIEYLAGLRTASAIESAEVAVVLLDALEVISRQDQRVISEVIESGHAAGDLAFGKWISSTRIAGSSSSESPTPSCIASSGRRRSTCRPGPAGRWKAGGCAAACRWRRGTGGSPRPAGQAR